MDRYVTFMKGQLRELLTGYGPLGILWFDGEWEEPWTHARGVDLYNYVRSLQPRIIVNNRVGKGRAGMGGMDQGAERVGDYGTPEQEIPATGFGQGVDWESCMTMNNHWGYNKNDQNWKSATLLVRNLIDCASKGGNYLLNVGPTAEGLFPQASVGRLAEIGRWMKVNGDAIHGTTASPFKKLPFGRATQKPGRIYLHVYDWPARGKLEVPLLSPVRRAYLLAAKSTALKFEPGAEGLIVHVPPAAPTPHAAVIVLEIDEPARVVEWGLRQAADGTITLTAADAQIVGRSMKLETKAEGIPNLGAWTDVSDSCRWTVTVRRPGTFSVEADYACDPASAGALCTIQAGAEELSATVEGTGGWDDFTKATVGYLKIGQAGPVTFTLKAANKPGPGVVNLRSLVLQPAD
jgi:alpha-L-fucosidase